MRDIDGTTTTGAAPHNAERGQHPDAAPAAGVRPRLRRSSPRLNSPGPVVRAVDVDERAGGLLLRRTPTWQRRLVAALIGLDLALVFLATELALRVRFGTSAGGGRSLYELSPLVFPLAWVAAVALGRGYEPRFLGSGSEEFRRLFDSSLRLFAVVATIAFGARLDLARGYVLLAFPAALVLTLLGRLVAREVLVRKRRAGSYAHCVVVVGNEGAVRDLVTAVAREPHTGFLVVGACLDVDPGGTGEVAPDEVAGVPVLGGPDEVIDALRSTGADTLAVTASPTFVRDRLRRLSWQLEGSGIDLVVAPSVTDIAGPRISIRPVAGLPLLHVDEPELSGARRLLKTALDRTTAAVALLMLSPVMIAIGVAIRVTSPGPALFRQTRVGADGRTFRIVKFRSMRATAEAELAALAADNVHGDGVLFKVRRDPRVTRVGRFLRRWSLDELPQLFNVLSGRMSLVGPRPPLPSEVARYAADTRRRLLVKPGLTGLWQVSGRSDLSWEESVRLDLRYVENWSLALDLLILGRTVVAVVRRRGAY